LGSRVRGKKRRGDARNGKRLLHNQQFSLFIRKILAVSLGQIKRDGDTFEKKVVGEKIRHLGEGGLGLALEVCECLRSLVTKGKKSKLKTGDGWSSLEEQKGEEGKLSAISMDCVVLREGIWSRWKNGETRVKLVTFSRKKMNRGWRGQKEANRTGELAY